MCQFTHVVWIAMSLLPIHLPTLVEDEVAIAANLRVAPAFGAGGTHLSIHSLSGIQ